MKVAVGLFFFTALGLYAQLDPLTQAPTIVAKCAPQYTDSARRAGLEGTVVLNARINSDGTARTFRVLRGLGLGLDEKAVEAVKNWRFHPALKVGQLVAAPATIEVRFRLDDPSEPCRAGLAQIAAQQ